MTKAAARVCAVLVALLLVGCSSPQTDGVDAATTSVETPVITGEPAGYNAADVTFATTMVAHHKQAIELARLAQEQSSNPQVLAAAERVAATAQPEINVLNVFLVQWNENPQGGATGPAAAPEVNGDAAIQRLRSLGGAEFDAAWVDTMIAQHRDAVETARTQIADGDNVDAVAMARQTVATQEAEIAQMDQLRRELG